MDWANKYKKAKEQKALNVENEAENEDLFQEYKNHVDLLFNRFKDVVKNSGIAVKTQKIKVSKEKRTTPVSKSEEMDILILSDNDNELHITPEGISFVGVKGRVEVKSYTKIYSFQSIAEKRIPSLRQPYLVLVDSRNSDNQYTWAYISPSEQGGNKIIKVLENENLEKILDDVFLS